MRRELHPLLTAGAVHSQSRLRSAIAPSAETHATPALRCGPRFRADSLPISQFSLRQRFLELLVFEAGRGQQVRHSHRLTGVRGGESSVERDASNIAAGNRKTRETIDFERIRSAFSLGKSCARFPRAAPDPEMEIALRNAAGAGTLDRVPPSC